MEHLRSRTVTVAGHQFEIRELTYQQYKDVTKQDEVDSALKAIKFGVPEFAASSYEDIGKLPARVVTGLSVQVMILTGGEDDAGNSEGAQTAGSSSV